jgi:hypothetical protein
MKDLEITFGVEIIHDFFAVRPANTESEQQTTFVPAHHGLDSRTMT